MKARPAGLTLAVLALVLAGFLAGCVSAPKKDLALERVRAQLEELKSDEELAGYAPLALGEAERALRQAEAMESELSQLESTSSQLLGLLERA